MTYFLFDAAGSHQPLGDSAMGQMPATVGQITGGVLLKASTLYTP
jgi:hypothetical protein